MNPIVTAYFRAADELPESDETARSPDGDLASPSSTSPSGSGPLPSEAIVQLLTEAGMMPERPRALLEGAGADPKAARLTCLRRLMAHVRDTHETAYFARSRELAFLANALLAGCSIQSRPFTLQEASDAAAATCNLGLECWPARWPDVAAAAVRDQSLPDSLLLDHDLVTAFEVGWSVLHEDVCLFAADQLISTLVDLHCIDRDIQRGLATLRRTLVEHRGAGAPWRACAAAEILAMLDVTAWIGVSGLLAECPVVAAALTAVLEGRTTRVSPTDFDFIATAAQIDDVRTFMRKLPGLLSG